MSKDPSLAVALSELQDVLCEADCWVDALRAPEDAPKWTHAVACMVRRITVAAEAVEVAARAVKGGEHG